jgi:hypothetical protein
MRGSAQTGSQSAPRGDLEPAASARPTAERIAVDRIFFEWADSDGIDAPGSPTGNRRPEWCAGSTPAHQASMVVSIPRDRDGPLRLYLDLFTGTDDAGSDRPARSLGPFTLDSDEQWRGDHIEAVDVELLEVPATAPRTTVAHRRAGRSRARNESDADAWRRKARRRTRWRRRRTGPPPWSTDPAPTRTTLSAASRRVAGRTGRRRAILAAAVAMLAAVVLLAMPRPGAPTHHAARSTTRAATASAVAATPDAMWLAAVGPHQPIAQCSASSPDAAVPSVPPVILDVLWLAAVGPLQPDAPCRPSLRYPRNPRGLN